jgi:hypothetical protein
MPGGSSVCVGSMMAQEGVCVTVELQLPEMQLCSCC